MVSECLHTMKSIKAPPRRTRPGQWYGQVHGSCTWLPSAIILLQGSTFTSAWTKLITLNQLLCNLTLWKVSKIEQHDMSYLQLRRVKQGVKGVPVKFTIWDRFYTLENNNFNQSCSHLSLPSWNVPQLWQDYVSYAHMSLRWRLFCSPSQASWPGAHFYLLTTLSWKLCFADEGLFFISNTNSYLRKSQFVQNLTLEQVKALTYLAVISLTLYQTRFQPV